MQNNVNAISEGNLDLFIRQVLNQATGSELAGGAQSTDMELQADVSDGVLADGFSSFEEITLGSLHFHDPPGEVFTGVIHEAVACTDVSAPTEHLYRDRTRLGSSGEEETSNDEDDGEEIMEITDILLQELLPKVDIDKTENVQVNFTTPDLPKPPGHSRMTFKPSSSSRFLNTLLGKTFSLHARKPTSPSEPDVRRKSQKKDKKGFKFWKKKDSKEPKFNEGVRPEAFKQTSGAEEPTNETKSKLFQFLTRGRQSGRTQADVPAQTVEDA